MSEQLQYGTETIDYQLSFSDRKTLGINVYPDKSVSVIAPVGSERELIEKKLLKRASWIKKQQTYFASIHRYPENKEFVSGETHKYLGRSYRLKVEEGAQETVKLRGKFFHITTKDLSRVETLLKDWYRTHALRKFQERLDLCYENMRREEIPYPKLSVRQMSKRWGSCTPEGKILLNPELVKAPVYCIDYVIVHELCHLKHHNHSTAFYDLKSKYMPDWEVRKARLEGI